VLRWAEEVVESVLGGSVPAAAAVAAGARGVESAVGSAG
jgi:hypothetical protein